MTKIFDLPHFSVITVTQAEFVDFETLMKESDFVIVTCALNDQTKGLFDAKAFSLMKPTAVFVNTSRGGKIYVFFVN